MMNSSAELPSGELDGLGNVPFDIALDALGHIQRRTVLFALLAQNPQGTLSIPGDLPAKGIDKYSRRIDNNHLSKLAAYDLIDWDEETHEVRRDSAFEEVKPLLELLDEHEDELPASWL